MHLRSSKCETTRTAGSFVFSTPFLAYFIIPAGCFVFTKSSSSSPAALILLSNGPFQACFSSDSKGKDQVRGRG